MKGGVGAGGTECGCIEQSLSTGLDSGSIEQSLSTGLPSSSLCRRVSHCTSYSNACQYICVLVESLSNILTSNSDLMASMPACGTLQNSKFLRKSCSFNCVQQSRLWWMGAGGRRRGQEGEEACPSKTLVHARDCVSVEQAQWRRQCDAELIRHS